MKLFTLFVEWAVIVYKYNMLGTIKFCSTLCSQFEENDYHFLLHCSSNEYSNIFDSQFKTICFFFKYDCTFWFWKQHKYWKYVAGCLWCPLAPWCPKHVLVLPKS